MTASLVTLINETAELLIKEGLALTTAESCTGGGLSFWLTSIPGSSTWFERGFVSYSNTAKIDMLEVKQATLEKYGAVSEETVREMAEGALLNSHAQVSIAITGIAGPEGGSKKRPVGTVWIGWAKNNTPTHAQLNTFTGNRQTIREQSIEAAMQGLLTYLKTSR